MPEHSPSRARAQQVAYAMRTGSPYCACEAAALLDFLEGELQRTARAADALLRAGRYRSARVLLMKSLGEDA